MSPTQKKRFTIVAAIVVGVSLASFFILKAFQANIEYFLTPKQISDGEYQANQLYRVGGLVKTGSVSTLSDGVTKRFDVTDCEYDVTVQYTGILPDLFREGQAIIINGKFENSTMIANQVLAKHDENYVPSEAAEAVMLAQANKCNTTEGPVSY